MQSNLFFLLTTVCVITFLIRTIYEILKHKKLITPNKISFVIIFINMALLWASWFALGGMDEHTIFIPLIIKYFGLILSVSGVVIFIISLFTIKSLETYEGDLITNGIYSKIRHPMYLSFILWIVGNSFYTGSFISFILSAPFILIILLWRNLEEKELEKRFKNYNEYRKKTLF